MRFMHRLFLLTLLVYLLSLNLLNGQTTISIIAGDSVEINLNNPRGTIQWQKSTNQSSWSNITGANSLQLHYLPPASSQWVRALIEEANCPQFIETPFKITTNDTSAVTFNQDTVTINNPPGEIITISTEGVIQYYSGALNASLQPGDLLSIAGQEFLLLAEAFIFQDGQLTIYTQPTAQPNQIILHFGNITAASVMGQVIDENGLPVYNAGVTIGNSTLLTDTFGVFILPAVVIGDQLGYVQVNKAGYFPGSRTFVPKPSGNNVLIKLIPEIPVGSFPATAGGSVSSEGVTVNFTPNSFSLNGTPYSGIVNFSLNYIDPESDDFFQEMPGNLIGSQTGVPKGLTSYGMIAARISDAFGNELQLAEGQFAHVEFPLSEGLQLNAADSIDLWSFDQFNGYWSPEGKAYRDNDRYLAEVAHFSFWNCDYPWNVVYLHGTVNDENGFPISGATVTLFNANTVGSDITNSSGQFGGLVPASQEFGIAITIGLGQESSQIVIPGNFGPFTEESNTISVVLETDVLTKSLSGRVVDCDTNAVSSAYLLSNSGVYFLQDGTFHILTYDTAITLRAIATVPNIEIGAVQTYSLEEQLNEIGDISLCNGDTLSFQSIADIDGNIYPLVKIGNLWWTTENLKTTRYTDGSAIVYTGLPSLWSWGNYEGRSNNYNTDVNFDRPYGKLYNWYAVSDPRGLCPAGSHPPTKNDRDSLSAALGGNDLSGGALKSTITFDPPNTGATNYSGFSALAGGWFYGNTQQGSLINTTALFWTSTNFGGAGSVDSYFWKLKSDSFEFMDGYATKTLGLSVRCVLD